MSGVAATPVMATDRTMTVLDQEIADLAPRPLVAARLLEALGNTESAVGDLSRLIAMDKGITAEVLRLVNSTYYGFPRQVTTIGQAVVILGFNTVRNLALAVSTFDTFDAGRNAPIDRNQFWEHSIGVAVCAQILARRKRLAVKVVEEAFLGGLLHDIGKLFLCQHFPDDYRAAIDEAWRQKVRVTVMEQRYCGASHPLIGARIAEKWNLPPSLAAAIGRHHDVSRAQDNFEMVALVNASDALTNASKIGLVGDPLPPTLSPEVAAWLGVDARMLQEVQEELKVKVDDAREFLRMAAGK
uniref:HDOD domain-containing protein n=1 Tax=uncultured Armatimonadetes bacterium TaxID=157466 RepID=A0A6J4IMN4_9BACT|nr:hypothetical protein AVDCRST_MAG63-2096 [uncultured Armatimonadetes bacterium]